MDERAQDGRVGEPLEVGAGLAQALALALDLTDVEAAADESVEVDPARDHVAAGDLGRDAELAGTSVRFEEHDLHINDGAFADLLADRVLSELEEAGHLGCLTVS